MQYFLDRFGRLIGLSGRRDLNFVGLSGRHFRRLLLWIWLTLVFFVILQNVDGFFLVQIAHKVYFDFGIGLLDFHDVKEVRHLYVVLDN